jgi:hypothetical protein
MMTPDSNADFVSMSPPRSRQLGSLEWFEQRKSGPELIIQRGVSRLLINPEVRQPLTDLLRSRALAFCFPDTLELVVDLDDESLLASLKLDCLLGDQTPYKNDPFWDWKPDACWTYDHKGACAMLELRAPGAHGLKVMNGVKASPSIRVKRFDGKKDGWIQDLLVHAESKKNIRLAVRVMLGLTSLAKRGMFELVEYRSVTDMT